MIERVVGIGRSECLDIPEAEAPDGFRRELEFSDRHQVECAQLVGRALALRIETADCFQCVAEKIEPHRLRGSGREQVDDATAHRIIAVLAHR